MGQFFRVLRAAAVLFALLIAPTSAQAQDFRDNFPQQFSDSPMGVNLQSGRFSYWLFSFAMGPFVVERGFNRSGFGFPASIYFETKLTSVGAYADTLTVNIGNPAVSLGNPTDWVQGSARPYHNSWLKGTNSTRLEFRLSYVNGVWTGQFTNVYSPGSGGWSLARVNGRYELTDKSGQRFVFADLPLAPGQNTPNGRLEYVVAADGSRITVTFDSAGRLLFARSNRGYALRYEYLNGGAQIKVCGFNLAQTYATASTPCSATTYVVTINNIVRSDGFLQPTSVVDQMGQATAINWGGYLNNFPVCITLPNSTSCEVTNSFGPQPGELPQLTKRDQVRVQTDAAGNTWTYNYEFPLTNSDDPPQIPGGPPILSTSWMTGPGYGAQANYENGLVKQLSSPGNGPNQFDYNGIELWKAHYPEANIIQIDRDWNQNAVIITEIPKPGSGLNPSVSTQSFPAPILGGTIGLCTAASERLCDKPIAQIDAKGNQTDYTYDPAHGGVLTKTLPAVQVDGTGTPIRPQVRYEYAQRFAWVKTSAGSYVQESRPVWVLTRERTCRTTATVGNACAGGAADEVVTDYDYGPNSGPNNLLLRGVAVTANLQTLRTCYAYDANGRKTGETQPLAGLAVCP